MRFILILLLLFSFSLRSEDLGGLGGLGSLGSSSSSSDSSGTLSTINSLTGAGSPSDILSSFDVSEPVSGFSSSSGSDSSSDSSSFDFGTIVNSFEDSQNQPSAEDDFKQAVLDYLKPKPDPPTAYYDNCLFTCENGEVGQTELGPGQCAEACAELVRINFFETPEEEQGVDPNALSLLLSTLGNK